MARGKKADVATDESKEERFIRLANFRAGKAVKAIEAIGPLGNTNQYAFTEEQRTAVFDTLENALTQMKNVFDNNGKTGGGFKLF